MTGKAPKLTNVSNPAAFGVEWTAGDNGGSTRFQLVNPRGTTTLLFGMRVEGRKSWTTTPVVDPSRFGLYAAPRTFRDFDEIARRYVAD
jgi:hypothetical protein